MGPEAPTSSGARRRPPRIGGFVVRSRGRTVWIPMRVPIVFSAAFLMLATFSAKAEDAPEPTVPAT